jgi:hypothetical protein
VAPWGTTIKTLEPYSKNTSQNSTSHISLSKLFNIPGYEPKVIKAFTMLIDRDIETKNKNYQKNKKLAVG